MKKILVAFDGSENALRAVRHAVQTAQENPSLEIVLLHVMDPMTCTPRVGALSPDELTRLCPDEADRILRPACKIFEDAGVAYQRRCRVGQAAGEIAKQVRESACDGVIMGTRGMGLLANVMIGSVASRVVHLVDVPAILIK